MIVNVSGSSVETYVECAEKIAELDRIPAIELNISCPNVKQGGMAFGVTAHGAASAASAPLYREALVRCGLIRKKPALAINCDVAMPTTVQSAAHST